MPDIKKLSVTYPDACLFLMPDKGANLCWIHRESERADVAHAGDEEAALKMIIANSRFADMPRAMHFDYDVGDAVLAKLAQAPLYGMRWFVSGLSADALADIRERIADFDAHCVVIKETVTE